MANHMSYMIPYSEYITLLARYIDFIGAFSQ